MANKGWNNSSDGDAANNDRDVDGAPSFVHGSRAAAHGPMNDPMDKRSDVFESESVMGTSVNR